MGFRRTAIAVVALGIVVPNQSRAQAALLGPGAAFIGIGVAHTATSDLDARLKSNGYPTFGQMPLTVQLGGYRLLSNNVMLGAELNGIGWGEKHHGGNDVGLGGGYATLGVGYAVVRKPHVRAYPRIGIGVGGFGLWIDNEADSIQFNSVLANPSPQVNTRSPQMNRDGAVLDLGGGVELLRGERSGALVGVRAGYLLTSFGKNWYSYDRKVTGGPDASISGAYIRVIIGGAWSR